MTVAGTRSRCSFDDVDGAHDTMDQEVCPTVDAPKLSGMRADCVEAERMRTGAKHIADRRTGRYGPQQQCRHHARRGAKGFTHAFAPACGVLLHMNGW